MKNSDFSPRWIALATGLIVCLIYVLGAKVALAQNQPPPAAPSNEVRIVGSDGSPVPFATVINRNNGSAVSADVLGNATLPQNSPQDTLVVKSIGYMDLVVPARRGVPNVLRMVNDPVAIETVQIVSEEKSFDMAALSASVQSLSPAAVEPVKRIETPETAAELLWSTGSVLVQQSQQGGGSPIIRGFEANRILLVVDGVRMNNAIYRSGHLQNAITIDPNVLEQTEVILGPNSVVYGSDALGGVIHYRTRTPRFQTYEWRTRMSTAYRSQNQGTRLHADVEYGGNRWATLTSVTASRFGDLRMGSWRPHGDSNWGLDTLYSARVAGQDTMMVNEDPSLQVGSGYDQIDVLQKFRYRSQIGLWGLNVQFSSSSNIPRYDLSAEFSGGQLKWAEWDYGPQQRFLAALNYSLYAQRIAGIQFNATLAYQDISEERIQRRFGSDWRESSRESVGVWSGNVTASRRFRHRTTISAGADFAINDVVSMAERTNLLTSSIEAISTRYPSGGSEMNMFGAFATVRSDIHSKGLLTAGLRYNSASLRAQFLPDANYDLPFESIDSRKGAWTGGLAMQWRASKAWRFNTNLSSGFRHPNIDDVGKVREKGGYVIVPNDSLRPEYLYSAEQGLTWNLGGRGLMELDATGFVTLWKDAIVPVNASLAGDTMMWIDGDSARVQTHMNASTALLRGARLSMRAQLFPRISLEGAVNWTYGQETESDTPLGHIPPTFGRIALDYEHKWMTWVLHSNFSGFKPLERFAPGSVDNPDLTLASGSPRWWTLNLEGRFRLSDGFELRVGARNLLDMHYRVFASGISAPGRGFHASAHLMF